MLSRTALPLAALALVASTALAGDLNPPAGPVASTMKDLDDVEPRIPLRNMFQTLTPIVIQFPGSYYLAEDIDALPNQHGIEILASDVTLDLNGFRIRGNTEVGSLDGISVALGASNTTIRNGSIHFFFQSGIDANEDLTLSDVRLVGNFGAGVNAGTRAIVTRCAAIGNGSRGYLLGFGAVVTDSVATGNTLNGFSLSSNAAVRGCTAQGNSGDGFFTSDYSSVLNCTSQGNGGNGYDTNGNTSIINCTAFNNTLDGYDLNSGGVIMGCVAQFNGVHGIEAFSDSVISSNTCADNIAGNGIDIGGSGNLIERNVCRGHNANLAAGILVAGDGSRIDSNHATDNFGGIVLTGTNNFLIRNSTHNNSAGNYSVALGNERGFTTNTLTTAGPWDNFVN